MSHNNDFLMEILDGEIPEAYRRKVEMEVSADPELSARLERFRSISRSMKAADQAQADEYQAAGIRLKSRLERSLDAAGQTRRPRAALRNLMDMTPRGFLKIPAPVAVFAAVLLVATLTLNLVQSLGPGNAPAGGMAAADSGMDVVNYTEFSDVDPALRGLLSVDAPAASSAGADDGINLQINVQDVEQLLKLLEEARTRNTGINDITIQIPSESRFEILGESELRRVEPRGNK
jgi:hypothetical protein